MLANYHILTTTTYSITTTSILTQYCWPNLHKHSTINQYPIKHTSIYSYIGSPTANTRTTPTQTGTYNYTLATLPPTNSTTAPSPSSTTCKYYSTTTPYLVTTLSYPHHCTIISVSLAPLIVDSNASAIQALAWHYVIPILCKSPILGPKLRNMG